MKKKWNNNPGGYSDIAKFKNNKKKILSQLELAIIPIPCGNW